MPMDPVARLLAERACERLMTDYTRFVDFGEASRIADLFTPDGIWEADGVRMAGRDAIRAGFSARQGVERRTSRHVCTNVAVDVLFAQPRNKPSANLHESLGLATVDTPTGVALKVDERRQTSVPGVYAAGDLATPFLPSVTQSSWQGAMAGIFAQQSMLA